MINFLKDKMYSVFIYASIIASIVLLIIITPIVLFVGCIFILLLDILEWVSRSIHSLKGNK